MAGSESRESRPAGHGVPVPGRRHEPRQVRGPHRHRSDVVIIWRELPTSISVRSTLIQNMWHTWRRGTRPSSLSAAVTARPSDYEGAWGGDGTFLCAFLKCPIRHIYYFGNKKINFKMSVRILCPYTFLLLNGWWLNTQIETLRNHELFLYAVLILFFFKCFK